MSYIKEFKTYPVNKWTNYFLIDLEKLKKITSKRAM